MLARRDWTDRAPPQYRMRPRRLDEIRALVLHQTSFEWAEVNPMWAQVRAHAVIHRSGLVTDLHTILTRMRYGCGLGNRWAINVELEGNLPLEYREGVPVYWRPERFRSTLTEPQIAAAREFVALLAEQVPGLMIGAHRQIELDRSGCCGPDIWREVGQWAVDELGMLEMPVAGGRPIPDAWRCSVAAPTDRAYTGPLEVPL